MTQAYQFNFEKTYKEIDVSGDIHRVEFNDEALTRYQKAVKRFNQGIKEAQDALNNINIETDSDDEIQKVSDKQKDVVKDVVEVFLGEGTFEGLYEKAGKSVMNLMSLVDYLIDIYSSEMKSKTEDARKKYLENVKK
ncbi:Uncharacterised protein [Lysinibacillus capsici]|uniref:Uncharacterized protein n=1 Tax=Lysinibacillus capsici TaxID=2115968 RepID=A0A2X0XKL9_9BACI|nr:hypothetical protein [Lysinibacillus capsici]SPT98426.1 Uncharacterised protein [Lysinibacillus capsici]